jgi:hypothetical protein
MKRYTTPYHVLAGLLIAVFCLMTECTKKEASSVPVDKDVLFDFILALGEKHAFTAESLSMLTGISLGGEPRLINKHYSSHFARNQYGGSCPYIKEIELRSPLEKENPGGLIILELIHTSHIKGSDVIARFGDMFNFIVPSPQQPEQDPISYEYKFEWGALRFGISRDGSEALVSVVLDAYESRQYKDYRKTIDAHTLSPADQVGTK